MISETDATQAETSSVPWWLILIEGLAAIIVGILLLANPGSILAVLVRLLGIYFFVTGILSIIAIFIDNTAWSWKLFAGIIGILTGFIIIEYPLWSTLLLPTTFVLVIAVFAISIGLINIIHGIQEADWGKGILGVISILLGVVLLARPILATISLPLVLGVLGILGRVLAVINAFRLKKEVESKAYMQRRLPQSNKDQKLKKLHLIKFHQLQLRKWPMIRTLNYWVYPTWKTL
jgi:uncharacterized membrane protein HdeD (DUF308 family)